MADSFELRDMSDRPQKAEQSTPVIDSDDADGIVTTWSLAAFVLSVPSPWYFPAGSSLVSCARLLSLAGLFVISPRLLIFMTGEPRTLLTPLEAFLAFQFGILLFSVSIGVLVNVRVPSAVSYVPADDCQVPFWHFIRGPSTRRSESIPVLSPITCSYHWRVAPDVLLSV